MYVLDSSIIIELINDSERAKKIFAQFGEELLITTSISMHEVLAGVQTEKEKFIIYNLFSSIKILDHTPNAARDSAEIYKDMAKAGKMINPLDILIAGICKANSAALVTLDKDFEKIKAIKSVILYLQQTLMLFFLYLID